MKHICKGNQVVILTGKDKGKKGTVVEVLPKKGKVKVQGLNLVTKHAKARRQGEASTIKQIEAYINISNVLPISPETQKPCRVNKMTRK